MEFWLEFRHHEHGSPSQCLFAFENIAVDMIAHVQDFSTRLHTKHAMQIEIGAALVDFPVALPRRRAVVHGIRSVETGSGCAVVGIH